MLIDLIGVILEALPLFLAPQGREATFKRLQRAEGDNHPLVPQQPVHAASNLGNELNSTLRNMLGSFDEVFVVNAEVSVDEHSAVIPAVPLHLLDELPDVGLVERH